MDKKNSLLLQPSLTRKLLATLFTHVPGVIEHRWMFPGRRMLSEFFPSVNTFLQSISTWPVKVHHYFGVATRKDSSSGKKENLSSLVCFHADIDYGPDRLYKNREDALAAIEAFLLRPSAVVDTGNGFHCYWFLLEPLPVDGNSARVESINRGIGRALNGDPVGDASRILRVPGTWNIKDPAHPKSVRLLWCEPACRYTLEDFAAYEVRQPERVHWPASTRMVGYGEMGGTAYGRAALAGELAKLSRATPGNRNNALNRASFRLGRLVVAGHLGEDMVFNLLSLVGGNVGLGEREIRATVRSGLRAGLAMGVAHD